jgi:hypothetical protein
MENKIEKTEITAESVHDEKLLLEKKMKRRSFILGSIIVGLIILLFFQKCSGDKKDAQIVNLIAQNDSLQNSLNDIKNHKCVLVINRGTDYKTGKNGYHINIVEVPKDDVGYDYAFIEDKYVIKRIPYKVKVPVPCPMITCPDANQDLINQIAKTESLLNDSLDVCLDKQYRQDSVVVLMAKKIQLKSFLLNSPPSINYTNTFIEYLPNPYREKAEKSFKRAILSGIISAGLYATSEALGNPVFIDGKDNASAQKKSDLILGLRISSGIFGFASLFETGRTFYFHKMEGKFIISPTTIGLTLYLDKPVKK